MEAVVAFISFIYSFFYLLLLNGNRRKCWKKINRIKKKKLCRKLHELCKMRLRLLHKAYFGANCWNYKRAEHLNAKFVWLPLSAAANDFTAFTAFAEFSACLAISMLAILQNSPQIKSSQQATKKSENFKCKICLMFFDGIWN